MLYHTCKCGKLESWTSGMPTTACTKCDVCGTGFGGVEAKPHDFTLVSMVDTDEGKKSLTRCQYCYKTRAKIEADEEAAKPQAETDEERQHREYRERCDSAMAGMLSAMGIASVQSVRWPHCDALVLHAPSMDCEYCNASGLQGKRIAANMNFTGQNDPDKLPDPATQVRPLEVINRWPGNVA